jgi:hypothetical protein
MNIIVLYTQAKLLAYIVGSFKNVIKGDLISIIPLLEQNITAAVNEGEPREIFILRLHNLKYNLFTIQKEIKYLNVLQENKVILDLKHRLISFSNKNKNNPNVGEPFYLTLEEMNIIMDSLQFYINIMLGDLGSAFNIVKPYRDFLVDFSIYNNLASGYLDNITFHKITSKKIFRKVRWGYDIYRGLLQEDHKLIGTLPGIKITR